MFLQVTVWFLLLCPDPSASAEFCFRKGFLSERFGAAHITGIGGPGALHVFRLDRLEDTGGDFVWFFSITQPFPNMR